MTRKKQKQEHNSSTILQSVSVMTASLRNVAFNICEKHEIQTLSPFSSERRGGWRASAPLSAAAAAALLCFTPSVYIKCHSHSSAPSITPNSKRLRPPAALPRRPDGRGSPSPRRVLHPRPFVFQNRRTFLPQKSPTLHNRKSLYNQQHITAIKNFSERRVLLWQPSPLRTQGG